MRGGADHSVIRWARNEPQDYPEKTGIAVATERHCAGPEPVFGLLGILPRRLHGRCGASVVTAPGAVATQRRIPMKLTDTQLVLLSAASQRQDGAVEIGTKLKGGAADKVGWTNRGQTGHWVLAIPLRPGRANRRLNVVSVASPGFCPASPVSFHGERGIWRRRSPCPASRSSDIHCQLRFVDHRESPSRRIGRADPFGILCKMIGVFC
jgi:hypothetical protein